MTINKKRPQRQPSKKQKIIKIHNRQTKLTKVLIKQICNYIKKGHSIRDACKMCDISKTIFYKWLSQGKEEKKEGKNTNLVAFVDGISKAKIQYKDSLISIVYRECKKNGRLALEVLSRRWPAEWGAVNKIKVENNSNPVLDSLNEVIALYKEKNNDENV